MQHHRLRTALVTAAAVLGVGLGGIGLAAATSDEASAPTPTEDAAEGRDTPIAGDGLDRASAAALAHTGGGTVTDTEVGDEDSYYEVEVTLDDGSQVDVQLDESFQVVGGEADHEEPGDD